MEVKGREMEEGEEAMKDWVSVRRKGQVETEKEEMQTKQEVKDFSRVPAHCLSPEPKGDGGDDEI